MRLLVTNTHAVQAYAITRCLRPYAERIVATISSTRYLGFWPADHAAYSRLIDRRYRAPDPEGDWHAGRIQSANTPLEEAFVARILEICADERIDTIFPSVDAWVYVFSKNKEQFEARGITIPVPNLETVLTPLDKYKTMLAADAVGFPYPETHLATSDEAVRRIARNLPPPWVIKLRFTTGSRGLAYIEDAEELVARCRVTRQRHGTPMIQEYIPGHQLESYYLVLDRDCRVVSVVTVRTRRRSWAFTDQLCAGEVVPSGPFVEQALALAKAIGWWGAMTVQYKVDPRDGLPKLMEINPRLGIHTWFRTELGINEPFLCLRIARGEAPEATGNYPYGCLLLKPLEDLAFLPLDLVSRLFYRFSTEVLKRPVIDPLAGPATIKDRLRGCWGDYTGNVQRRLTPYFGYASEDPLPLLLWISKLIASPVDRLGRRVGRKLLRWIGQS